jgi:hypothetical protein
MVWAWFLNRKSVQATLQSAHPAAKPKKKRYLTVTERRLLRNFRGMEVMLILIAVSEPYRYLMLSTFPPKSTLDWIDVILSVGVMFGFTCTIILMERNEIKQLKNGEFMKRIKQLARERKKK